MIPEGSRRDNPRLSVGGRLPISSGGTRPTASLTFEAATPVHVPHGELPNSWDMIWQYLLMVRARAI